MIYSSGGLATLQDISYIITEEELEKEINNLKELNRKIKEALKRALKDRHYLTEYDKAVQEYENAKNELFRRLQGERRGN